MSIPCWQLRNSLMKVISFGGLSLRRQNYLEPRHPLRFA